MKRMARVELVEALKRVTAAHDRVKADLRDARKRMASLEAAKAHQVADIPVMPEPVERVVYKTLPTDVVEVERVVYKPRPTDVVEIARLKAMVEKLEREANAK